MYISCSRLTSYVARRAFTDYTFPMVCSLFGLLGDPTRFPSFSWKIRDGTGTPFDAGASNDLKHLIADLQIWRGSISLTLANKATCSEFISPFLFAVSSFFKDIIVKPQRLVRGRYGRGSVDFALVVCMSGVILGVTEIIGEDFRKGVAQNFVKLESSLPEPKRGDTSIGGGDGVKVFGLVTDAKEWWALECAKDTKTENLSFRMSNITTINYDGEEWQKTVEKVFFTLVWLLEQNGGVRKSLPCLPYY